MQRANRWASQRCGHRRAGAPRENSRLQETATLYFSGFLFVVRVHPRNIGVIGLEFSLLSCPVRFRSAVATASWPGFLGAQVAIRRNSDDVDVDRASAGRNIGVKL